MEWLNYHHLLYFYVVAREGTISEACGVLHLAQPTISGQIKALEEKLGEKLFERVGRRLVLTEVGQVVYEYADKIFALGGELQEALRGRLARKTLVVGIADVLPKLVAYRLLEPAKDIDGGLRIECREGKAEELFGQLALHKLDVVLTDSPMGSDVRVKAYNHELGECGMSFFASSKLARKYKKNFPHSLDAAPMLLPSPDSDVRHSLDLWLAKLQIRPLVIGEFADSALMRAFGDAGDGIFPVPGVLEGDYKKSGLQLLGRTNEVRESFYVISVERKLKHPAVVAIWEGARNNLFG